jgi:hypothetical protein
VIVCLITEKQGNHCRNPGKKRFSGEDFEIGVTKFSCIRVIRIEIKKQGQYVSLLMFGLITKRSRRDMA